MTVQNSRSIITGPWSRYTLSRKIKTVTYSLSIILLVIILLCEGAAALRPQSRAARAMQQMGYPLHFITLLGLWKILGSIVLMSTSYPRLREWAYAGVFFSFSGTAMAQLICSGCTLQVLPHLAATLLVIASRLVQPADHDHRT